ncbi:PREDICTED: probable 39S ribosomal protein L24, mitochondrial [Wasmannia auropunctata]|uniref:probable 39S ribosomal protein L24, mitochondrial n=1 Tax=Wasmannia auropunctata TaxID=64793 RepID=UPI0005EF0950|nr:PREDICTED: probable 39S ribosomal protein L24, mitochondrial [Wasmannia auropunctata]XP_011707204.1 PREDICTED: probable 39S ribosomal protein L24, mitochondrial [Wasmannia auropunctata]
MRLTSSLLKRVGEWSTKYSNLPDRYIKRAMEQVYWKTPRKPNYLPRTIERKRFHFSIHRPWTHDFHRENAPGKMHPFIHVEPIKDWSFFRGDRVEILVGKDKGKQGIVKEIYQERNWVIVEGLNMKLTTTKWDKKYPPMCILKEQPLLITSQVQLVDPSDMQAASIEWRYTEDGQRVRISVRSGRVIPIPVSSQETIDYKIPRLYVEQAKDTTKADVETITYEPALKTFQMDVMDEMGIKEDRVPKKFYWY